MIERKMARASAAACEERPADGTAIHEIHEQPTRFTRADPLRNDLPAAMSIDPPFAERGRKVAPDDPVGGEPGFAGCQRRHHECVGHRRSVVPLHEDAVGGTRRAGVGDHLRPVADERGGDRRTGVVVQGEHDHPIGGIADHGQVKARFTGSEIDRIPVGIGIHGDGMDRPFTERGCQGEIVVVFVGIIERSGVAPKPSAAAE